MKPPRRHRRAQARQERERVLVDRDRRLGPLAMHFYDLGPGKGLTLVGIERPAK